MASGFQDSGSLQWYNLYSSTTENSTQDKACGHPTFGVI